MNDRWLRRIFVVLGVLMCLGVFAYFAKDFWHDQFHAFYLGQVEFVAERYQDLPKDIDTVEVFTLEENENGNTNGFVGDMVIGTLAHKTLTGEDAKDVVFLWRCFPVGRELQAMCFNPAYGLQFKRNGQIYFQTSVCWDCSGYTLPVPPFGIIQNGFDSKSEGAQKLLKTLERYLPLPPEPRKVQPQKPVAGVTNS
jgi:hypothetical protein